MHVLSGFWLEDFKIYNVPISLICLAKFGSQKDETKANFVSLSCYHERKQKQYSDISEELNLTNW